VFGGEPRLEELTVDLKVLHAKIGQLALENDFLEGAHIKAGMLTDGDLELMRRIDEVHLELPFAGARMLRDLLRAEGFAVGRKHMTTLMRRMGITALYRKPNTSRRAPGQTIYPYLLRTLAITRANHVWAMNISYTPMARGFIYLAAVIDEHVSRQHPLPSDQVRGGLPPRLRDRECCPRRHRPLHQLLQHRPHSSHQAQTPDVVYFASLPQPSAEAACPRRIHLKSVGICSDQRGQLFGQQHPVGFPEKWAGTSG